MIKNHETTYVRNLYNYIQVHNEGVCSKSILLSIFPLSFPSHQIWLTCNFILHSSSKMEYWILQSDWILFYQQTTSITKIPYFRQSTFTQHWLLFTLVAMELLEMKSLVLWEYRKITRECQKYIYWY